MNLPNMLTALRLILCPIFIVLYLWHTHIGITEDLMPIILFILLVFCEVSDIFDGYLARKYNQVTSLGKIFDPIADTTIHLTFFIMFIKPPIQLPIILVLVFLYRELAVGTLRTLCALQGFPLSAQISGKIKTISQAIAILSVLLLMILETQHLITIEQLQYWSTFLVSISAIYTIYSGVNYYQSNWHYIKR